MNAGNLIFLLLLVGGVFWMFSMHRGGHSHGGMGGCGGGHGHGNDQTDERGPDTAHDHGQKPLLGPPGTQSGAPAPAPAPAPSRRHVAAENAP